MPRLLAWSQVPVGSFACRTMLRMASKLHACTAQAKTYLGSAARRLLASPSASRTFESFLAANPPPSAPPPEDSWTHREGSQHAAGTRHPRAHVPCGEPRRFHWRQAQAEAAQLARSHEMHWSPDMDGYLCLPMRGKSSPASAAAAEQVQQADHTAARLSEQQQQQQQQSACTATTTAAAAAAHQVLLLKLPPVLWGSVHMPQGRLHDVIGGKAAPGLQLIVLLSADSAALAVCSEGAIVRHKTMTGYTVRRNRTGKAQLTYRRTRTGKNSVGGGIRMRETHRLFTNVAMRLTEWRSDVEACDLSVCSGGVRVWNEVFAAFGNDAIVQRADEWWRLPLSVPRPRYNDLQRALGVLSYGSVTPLTTAP